MKQSGSPLSQKPYVPAPGVCLPVTDFGPAIPPEQFDIKQAKIRIQCGGLKAGNLPPKAFFYMDARGLPDSSKTSPGGTGDYKPFRDYVRANINVPQYTGMVLDALNKYGSRRRGRKLYYGEELLVCCFCAFGNHRSRSLAHILVEELEQLGFTNVKFRSPVSGDWDGE